jgi:hypothetical protein
MILNKKYIIFMDRVEELNKRMQQRNITETTPAFYFSPRPVPTKYTTLPIADQIAPSSVDIAYTKSYNMQIDYLPASSAPWSGFADNIDIDTQLKKEKNYIPSSKSSLYTKPKIPSTHDSQPFPGLFADATSSYKSPVFNDRKIFNNSTSQKINL